MLKVLRESAIENPWFYRLIMLFIAVAFIITMGWGVVGYSKSNKKDYIAKVDGEPISVDEYQQSYRTAVAYFKSMMKDQFSDDMLNKLNVKKNVVNNLIEKRLWLKAAQDMGLAVSDEEVRAVLKEDEVFQKNKVFDESTYKEVLAANHLTPMEFEKRQRNELLYQKVRSAVRDSVALSPSEQVHSLSPQEIERVTNEKLSQKREKAVLSFIENLKAKAKIEIKNEYING